MADDAANVVLSDGVCGFVLHPPKRLLDSGFEHCIDLTAGPFQGPMQAYAYMNDYSSFYSDLAKLYETLSGKAVLRGYENFNLEITGDGLGHLSAKVAAFAGPSHSTRLTFDIGLDRTHLPRFMSGMKRTFLPPT